MKKSLKRREFTKEFKLQVVAEVDAGKPQAPRRARTSSHGEHDCQVAQATASISRVRL